MSGTGLAAGGLTFDIAGADAAADLARLQAVPMRGAWLTLSLRSVPDYWRAAALRGETSVVVARRASGEAVGMCARSVRMAYINGGPRSLGYLGDLRLSADARRRPHLVRDGFQAVHRLLHDPVRTPYYVTAIAEGNEAAERLLTAGLPGFPTYRPAGELVTFAIAARSSWRPSSPNGGVTIETPGPGDWDAIVSCLARNNARYQFAPMWTLAELRSSLRCPGLGLSDFLVARRESRIVGCLALWDQRSVKHIVIEGYRPLLARTRHLANAASALFAWPALPRVGTILAEAFLSHVAIDDDDPAVLLALVRKARDVAARRGIALVLLGLAARNPMCHAVHSAFPHRAYRSHLFVVHWPDGRDAALALDDRIVHPEAAIL